MTTQQPQYKLEAFEGPLDLLLALIGKKKVEIWDIHIAEILEQYLAYLALLREMDLDVTGDFLAMASTLLYIKSRMLLPVLEPQEPEEDPRAELARRLQEYQRCKELAAVLVQRMSFDRFTKLPEPIPAERAEYEQNHALLELQRAYENLTQRADRKLPPPVTSFAPLVGKERIPVSVKIQAILKRLRQKGQLTFFSLFSSAKSRSEIVATFLAVLELSKANKLTVEDDERNPANYILTLSTGGQKDAD